MISEYKLIPIFNNFSVYLLSPSSHMLYYHIKMSKYLQCAAASNTTKVNKLLTIINKPSEYFDVLSGQRKIILVNITHILAYKILLCKYLLP